MEGAPYTVTPSDLKMAREAGEYPELLEGYRRVAAGEADYQSIPAFITAAFKGLKEAGLSEGESMAVVMRALGELGVTVEETA